MNFKIHGHNIDMEDGIRQYAEEKMGRLERHFDHILEGRLELEGDALRRHEPIRRAHIHLRLNGTSLEAREEGSTAREAIDLCVDKMDEQLRRYKERLTAHKAEPPGRLAEL